MDKLIITCCTSDPRGYKGTEIAQHMPVTTRQIADAARTARDAGAAVVHVHQPLTGKKEGRYGADVEAWLEIKRLIQRESDVIFQHGLGGNPYFPTQLKLPTVPAEEQSHAFDLGVERPEMISCVIGAHDHDWGAQGNAYRMVTREEAAERMRLCRKAGVKPELEMWDVGSYFNIQWLVDRKLLDPPYWYTLFFAGRGGQWCPPTVEELHHRLKDAPQPALWQVSIWGGFKGTSTTQQQLALFAGAIAMGGHIRVGMEDSPFLWDGVAAKSNVELVERVVRIARDLGREVATPDEARQIIGLPPRT